MGEVVDRAEGGISEMESLFETLRCREEENVIFATFQLKGSAKLWWGNMSIAHMDLQLRWAGTTLNELSS